MYLVNDSTKQINYILMNASYLFSFLSSSPVFSVSYEGKTLCAMTRLKQHIISACKLSFPRDSFSQSCFVSNIVVCRDGCKNQGVNCAWPTTYKLVVHMELFRLLS